jgi:hypothetical protein
LREQTSNGKILGTYMVQFDCRFYLHCCCCKCQKTFMKCKIVHCARIRSAAGWNVGFYVLKLSIGDMT